MTLRRGVLMVRLALCPPSNCPTGFRTEVDGRLNAGTYTHLNGVQAEVSVQQQMKCAA